LGGYVYPRSTVTPDVNAAFDIIGCQRFGSSFPAGQESMRRQQSTDVRTVRTIRVWSALQCQAVYVGPKLHIMLGQKHAMEETVHAIPSLKNLIVIQGSNIDT
jgi:hypothetical protein